MTGNQIKGKGFRGALRYNLAKVEKNVAEVLDHSFARVNENSIMKEIQLVRILKPNLQKFFYHTSINFPPHEDISNNLMKQIAQDYLKGIGFNQHQFIVFRHHDANHPHLHILVNRIGYDGKVLSDSNDFARSEKVLRELEKKYQLTQVISSKQATRRAYTKDELEMMKRTNAPSQKVFLQKMIKDVLNNKGKLSCSEFVLALQSKDIHPKFNIAKTGYVSGISYGYNGMVITGSKLGFDFKWTTVREKIDYNQDRDREIVLNTNLQKGIPSSGTSPKQSQSKTFDTDKSKPFDLGSFLNGPVQGSIINVVHSPDIDPASALGLKFQKKRRKRFRR